MSPSPASEKQIVIDHVVLICKGCSSERTMIFDVPLRGAEELVVWMKTKPTACECGAATCDIKAHLMTEQ